MNRLLATQFLFCDEKNLPNVNDETYKSLPIDYYITEADRFASIFLELLTELDNLNNLSMHYTETDIQYLVYESAKKFDSNDVRRFFKRTYQVLFNSNEGPRLPTFISLVSIDEFKNMYLTRSSNPFFADY